MAAIGTNQKKLPDESFQIDSEGLPPQRLGDSFRCIVDIKRITDIRDCNLPGCLDLLPVDENQKKPLSAVIKETRTAFGLFAELLKKLENRKDELVLSEHERLRGFRMPEDNLDKVKSEAFNKEKPYILRAKALITLEPEPQSIDEQISLFALKGCLIQRSDHPAFNSDHPEFNLVLGHLASNLVDKILEHMRLAGNTPPAAIGNFAQLSGKIEKDDVDIREKSGEVNLNPDLKFNALDLTIAKLLMFSLVKEQQDLENPDFNDDVETLEEYINELKEIAKHRTKLEALLTRQKDPSRFNEIKPELDTVKEKIKMLESSLTETASRFKEIRRRHVLRSATLDADRLFKAREIERQFSEDPRLKNPTCEESQLLGLAITSGYLSNMLTRNFDSLFGKNEKNLLPGYISEVVQSFESKVDKAATESSAIDT